LWEFFTWVFQPRWLPRLSAVGTAWWHLLRTGQLSAFAITGESVGLGLALVLLCSTVLVTSFQLFPLIRRAIDPYLDAIMAAPVIALIPVLMLVFGTGTTTRVVTVLIFALAPVVVTWDAAMRSKPDDLLEMAKSFEARPLRRIWAIYLPSAAPVIIAGARIGIVQGIKGAVSAEILIAVVGVGRLLADASAQFDLATLYAVVLTLLAASFAAYLGLTWLERRTSRHQ
jgi:ABC-type nitrate/sulfonate/bicarbonate transport system permease component